MEDLKKAYFQIEHQIKRCQKGSQCKKPKFLNNILRQTEMSQVPFKDIGLTCSKESEIGLFSNPQARKEVK